MKAKRTVHDRIIVVLKVLMFTAFAYNAIRVIVRTWKYGGISHRTMLNGEELQPKGMGEE